MNLPLKPPFTNDGFPIAMADYRKIPLRNGRLSEPAKGTPYIESCPEPEV